MAKLGNCRGAIARVMRVECLCPFLCILMAAALTPVSRAAAQSEPAAASIRLEDDQPVSLRFFGSPSAELFSREVEASFRGVLRKNFVSVAGNGLPAGFVSASVDGRPWTGTMWSRDGGTFMRELVMRGYYQHAALLAECLMKLVQKNKEGFYAFPEYFKGSEPGSGSEVDGTASIVIGMALLWERLPAGNPTKEHIHAFLLQDASPVNYFKLRLQNRPLIPGTGEFGCGYGPHLQDECDNVVQNYLTALALFSTANLAEESGSGGLALEYRRLAAKILDGMDKYLVDKDGSWIWCIDPKTLKPDPEVLTGGANLGFGGLNGVAAMYADVLGLQPLASSWPGIQHSEQTLQRLYQVPLRKAEFDRYGFWSQFDVFRAGLNSSPSYGQGYALQTMLLFDKLDMADKGFSWLANATYDPVPEYKLHRDSPYYFYEGLYPPEAVGKIPLNEGCGALNLVNVSEPLKVSRLVLGVDDSALRQVLIIPRIPDSWKGVEARNWPIRTSHGVVRADIRFEKKRTGAEMTVKLAPGQEIDVLQVRMPSKQGYVWREQKHAAAAHFVTQ